MAATHAGVQRGAAKRELAYELIADAARNNKPFPTNTQIAEALGYKQPSSGFKLVLSLHEEGRLNIEWVGKQRRATIPGTNYSTAVVGDRLLLPRKALVRRIVELAATVFGVRIADILGPSRKRPFARARQAVCYVAWQQGWSSPQIGRILERDHSTILHSRDMVELLIERDVEFAQQVAALSDLAAEQAARPPAQVLRMPSRAIPTCVSEMAA